MWCRMIDGGHKTAAKVVQNYFCQMSRLSIVFPVKETKKEKYSKVIFVHLVHYIKS